MIDPIIELLEQKKAILMTRVRDVDAEIARVRGMQPDCAPHVYKPDPQTPAVAPQCKMLDSSPEIEERRRAVMRLLIDGENRATEIGRALQIGKTIYNDLIALRDCGYVEQTPLRTWRATEAGVLQYRESA